jgi:hypothetical protein
MGVTLKKRSILSPIQFDNNGRTARQIFEDLNHMAKTQKQILTLPVACSY